MVDNTLAKARGLSLHTGAQTMLYLSHVTANDKASLHIQAVRGSSSLLITCFQECLENGQANNDGHDKPLQHQKSSQQNLHLQTFKECFVQGNLY